ncbi:hypothetical protein T4A_1490 [Trichinella pseudospiralis]|nr:hypothetical protein T4A_1490 [Trichinella pseudospiralis]
MGRTFWRSALTQSDSAALLTAIKEVWHLVCFCIREAASLGQCWFCYISYNEFQGRTVGRRSPHRDWSIFFVQLKYGAMQPVESITYLSNSSTEKCNDDFGTHRFLVLS